MSVESIARAAIAALTLFTSAAFVAAPAAPAATPATPAAATPAALSPIEAARQAAVAAGIKITDLKPGKGPPALTGATVRVDYTGWLQDTTKPEGKGMKFDSSLDREPFIFPLGQRQVIQGWELGVAGMQAGGKRLLVIPPEVGYGQKGTPGGPIPPNATLVFEVKLIDFLPAIQRAAPTSN